MTVSVFVSISSLKVDEICKSIAKYEGTVIDLRRQADELIQLIPSQKDQVSPLKLVPSFQSLKYLWYFLIDASPAGPFAR